MTQTVCRWYRNRSCHEGDTDLAEEWDVVADRLERGSASGAMVFNE